MRVHHGANELHGRARSERTPGIAPFGWIDRAIPFHCSIWVSSPYEPMAVQAEAEVHERPMRPAVGLGTTVQTDELEVAGATFAPSGTEQECDGPSGRSWRVVSRLRPPPETSPPIASDTGPVGCHIR